MSRFILLASILTVLLTACLPAAPTQQPSGPSTEDLQATIGTTVALTLTSIAETQVAAYTPTPTETPIPTFTPTIYPTLTPFATPTIYYPPVVASPQVDYSCAMINKIPFDNTVFKPNKDFDIKFWLKNTGKKSWSKGADLAYNDGPNMIVGKTAYELPKVDPGEMVGPFIFDAMSPNKIGTHVMTLKVQGGFCYPYIRIIVKR